MLGGRKERDCNLTGLLYVFSFCPRSSSPRILRLRHTNSPQGETDDPCTRLHTLCYSHMRIHHCGEKKKRSVCPLINPVSFGLVSWTVCVFVCVNKGLPSVSLLFSQPSFDSNNLCISSSHLSLRTSFSVVVLVKGKNQRMFPANTFLYQL